MSHPMLCVITVSCSTPCYSVSPYPIPSDVILPHPIPYPDQAAKRLARQEKFGFVNADAEKKAKEAQLAAEQAEKKAKRIARFGEDTSTKTPTPKPAAAKTGGRGGRRQGGGGGGPPVSAKTMLSQGLKSSR